MSAVVGAPLLAVLLSAVHSSESIATEVLSYQLLVVVVALVGGIWPALFAAVLSGLTLDFFFLEPNFQIMIAHPLHIAALVLHIAIAALVSFVVDRAERQARSARLFRATASELEPMAASDRVRGALLSALSHDLRRPLAAATTAVGGLRAADGVLSPEDRRELLVTADESLTALSALVTDLLDVSRLQAGVLTIAASPVDPIDVILPALDELELGPGEVLLDLEHGMTQALADAVLLQRVLVNLLANAMRYSPSGVGICTDHSDGRVRIRIIDHGPGIPAARRGDVFVPFQRFGDTDNTTGLGLGLALSRGFIEAMKGTLTPEETPGGGLTMVVSLPATKEEGR
ncbi:MAG TPA: DUF4118 domain-containing protein [Arachnia sp.]|nr:DUF4118 domain-containing protein [Arachnia sp.]